MGGSNEYTQSMFRAKIRKKSTSLQPRFAIHKRGFKESILHGHSLLSSSSFIFHVLNTSTRLVGQFVQFKLTQKRKKCTNVCMLCSQIGSATFKKRFNFM